MSSATTTNQYGGLREGTEYDITQEQQEALEHLAEHGEYTAEIAEQLLQIIN